MKIKFFNIIFVFTLLFGLNTDAKSSDVKTVDDLVFYTEEYPPYNFTGPDGKVTGLAVDLLDAALKRIGSKKGAKDVKLMSWSDGYSKALKENNAVIFSTTRSDERDLLFKWAGPIIPTKTALLAKKGTPLVSNVASLKGKKIAVIKDDIGQQLARNEGVKESYFAEFNNLDDLVKSLESGKSDYWAYEENVALWTLKNKGLLDKYEVVGSLGLNDLSYSFNKNIPDSIIIQLQDAIDETKSFGYYQEILEKYQ